MGIEALVKGLLQTLTSKEMKTVRTGLPGSVTLTTAGSNPEEGDKENGSATGQQNANAMESDATVDPPPLFLDDPAPLLPPTTNIPVPPVATPFESGDDSSSTTSTTSTNSYSPSHLILSTTPGTRFSSLIHTLILPSDLGASHFLSNLLPHLPHLSKIIFTLSENTRLTTLSLLVDHVGPRLRVVDFLKLSVSGDSMVLAGQERIVELLNKAVNLRRLGVDGLLLSDGVAKRLLFVLKLNSTLVHPASGALGNGLQELYLGGKCQVPVSFLEGLKNSCKILTEFHLQPNLKVVPLASATDANNNNSNDMTGFDLKGFVAHFGGTLKKLTVVGCDRWKVRGNIGGGGILSGILASCPHLVFLHLRSDHIDFNFFKSLVALSSPPPPASSSFPPNGDGGLQEMEVDGGEKGEGGRKFKLELLVVQMGFGAGAANEYPTTATVPPIQLSLASTQFYTFSTHILVIHSTGVTWPETMDGQRDVLRRAGWMGTALSSTASAGKGNDDGVHDGTNGEILAHESDFD
ncbi:hypothetical protein T439DRAFT_243588 [Meredithblackwellia eburnea MCA 4105]